jgi:hypothetical protein
LFVILTALHLDNAVIGCVDLLSLGFLLKLRVPESLNIDTGELVILFPGDATISSTASIFDSDEAPLVLVFLILKSRRVVQLVFTLLTGDVHFEFSPCDSQVFIFSLILVKISQLALLVPDVVLDHRALVVPIPHVSDLSLHLSFLF